MAEGSSRRAQGFGGSETAKWARPYFRECLGPHALQEVDTACVLKWLQKSLMLLPCLFVPSEPLQTFIAALLSAPLWRSAYTSVFLTRL